MLDDGSIALPSLNLAYSGEDGKNIGPLARSRGYRIFTVVASGTRFLAGDFTRLPHRKGVSLWAEDAAGKLYWSRNFAGEAAMTVEQITANADRTCVAGKTDGGLHGQAHSGSGKSMDYYVFCTNPAGVRLYTRLICRAVGFRRAGFGHGPLRVNYRPRGRVHPCRRSSASQG